MRMLKIILGIATPLLLLYSGLNYVANHQLNVATFAQPALRVAIDTNSDRSFRSWETIENDKISIQYKDIAIEEVEMILEIATNVRESLDERFDFEHSQAVKIVIMPTRDEMRSFFKWSDQSSAVGVYFGNRIFLLKPSLWIEAQSIEELTHKYMKNGPIAHEYVHFIIDRKYHNNVPRWYNEGIAQYEEYQYQGYEWIEEIGTLDRQLYAYWEMRDNFEQLKNQPLAYRQAFKFVEYQIERYGEDKHWQFLQEIEKRVSFEQAFANVYEMDVIKAWIDFTQYVQAFQVR